MKAQQSNKYIKNDSYILGLHHELACARQAQDDAIEAFVIGELSEDKAIEAVNYLETLELCFVKAGGCYKDLYH